MHRNISSRFLRGLLCLFMGNTFMLCGCGGSATDGTATASTAEGKRFESVQKLGTDMTKEAIAAKRKQALAEIAQKKASHGK